MAENWKLLNINKFNQKRTLFLICVHVQVDLKSVAQSNQMFQNCLQFFLDFIYLILRKKLTIKKLTHL